ncbi:MAG: GTP-binding protein [Candidatus Helarchaeota archaeon]
MLKIDLSLVNKVLENLINALTSIQAAMIFDNKGNLLTSMMNSTLDEEEIGGTTSLISFISDKIKIDFETGLFQNSSLSTDYRKFIFRQIDDLILVLICDLKSDLNIINPYSDYVATKILKINKNVQIDPSVPTLGKIERPKRKPKNEYVFKILILGDAGVGKTTTTVRFAQALFTSEYKPTLGVNIVRNEFWMNDTDLIHFSIWDLAGQDRWASMRGIYYSGAQGALLLFDTTRLDSFRNLDKWVKEINTNTINIPVVLVGNKIDLKDLRKVSKEEGIRKAQEYGYRYIETSAKTSENIKETFKLLVKDMIKGKI